MHLRPRIPISPSAGCMAKQNPTTPYTIKSIILRFYLQQQSITSLITPPELPQRRQTFRYYFNLSQGNWIKVEKKKKTNSNRE